ncbi:MAG: putative Splicing factor 3B subunit 3, partial [Streblomastix strix]
MAAFRPVRQKKDFLALGSDSGKLSIVEYDASKERLVPVFQEAYGKTGCRRIIPGQFIAVDPKGRAIMIAAIERQKLVYILNINNEEKLIISSPLVANNNNSLVYSVVALDVELRNPMFACLEVSYGDPDRNGEVGYEPVIEKHVVFYEVDLGLNNVVKCRSERVDPTSNLIIAVPSSDTSRQQDSNSNAIGGQQQGSSFGGGIIVCSEDTITFISPQFKRYISYVPRRRVIPEERGILIVAHAMHISKTKMFFLLQNELGDIFKLTFTEVRQQQSQSSSSSSQYTLSPFAPQTNQFLSYIDGGIRLVYFDTLPTACVSLCILRTGHLFAPSEYGAHIMYHIRQLGNDDEEERIMMKYFQQDFLGTSITLNQQQQSIDDQQIDTSHIIQIAIQMGKSIQPRMFYFKPHTPILQNIEACGQLLNMSPITDMKIGSFAQKGGNLGTSDGIEGGGYQIICVAGRGPHSSLRVIQHGISVTTLGESPLQGIASGVWSIKENKSDQFHQYIIISFLNATLVLAIGESIEEVTTSGLYGGAQTLCVSLLDDDNGILQVHTKGLRRIFKNKRVSE